MTCTVLQEVGAHIGKLVLDAGGHTVAQTHNDHNSHHANDDAQHGKEVYGIYCSRCSGWLPGRFRRSYAALLFGFILWFYRVRDDQVGLDDSLRRVGVAVVHHLTVFQPDDTLRLHGDGIVVSDEHHGIALPVQLLQHFQYLTAGVAVQCAGGLVGQNDSRTACQCPRDGNTLLLTAGKLVGLVPELIAKTHPLQCGGARR